MGRPKGVKIWWGVGLRGFSGQLEPSIDDFGPKLRQSKRLAEQREISEMKKLETKLVESTEPKKRRPKKITKKGPVHYTMGHYED